MCWTRGEPAPGATPSATQRGTAPRTMPPYPLLNAAARGQPPLITRHAPRTTRLPPGILRSLAGAAQAGLLALLFPWVAGQEAGPLQRRAVRLAVGVHQGAGQAVADRACLPGHAAADHLDHHVPAARRLGD